MADRQRVQATFDELFVSGGVPDLEKRSIKRMSLAVPGPHEHQGALFKRGYMQVCLDRTVPIVDKA